jgi:hypothetical protein
MDIEQRKFPRFSVQDQTFAALGSEFETVGKVNDISIKGLALSYLCESNKTGFVTDFSQVDIFLSGNSFHLPKVLCEIVYDIQDSQSIKDNIIIKRWCGLHFGKLSKNQSEQLELFLKNYTTEPLSS